MAQGYCNLTLSYSLMPRMHLLPNGVQIHTSSALSQQREWELQKEMNVEKDGEVRHTWKRFLRPSFTPNTWDSKIPHTIMA